MSKFFLFLSFFLLCHNVFGQEKKYSTKNLSSSDKIYLCVMDKSTGFEFDQSTKTWDPYNFNVEDQKFILELDKRNFGIFYRFGLKNTNKKKINSKCKKSKITQLIECNGWLGDVNFNAKSNLVTYSFNFGYAVNDKSVWTSNSSGPFISIGKCSLIKLNTK